MSATDAATNRFQRRFQAASRTARTGAISLSNRRPRTASTSTTAERSTPVPALLAEPRRHDIGTSGNRTDQAPAWTLPRGRLRMRCGEPAARPSIWSRCLQTAATRTQSYTRPATPAQAKADAEHRFATTALYTRACGQYRSAAARACSSSARNRRPATRRKT